MELIHVDAATCQSVAAAASQSVYIVPTIHLYNNAALLEIELILVVEMDDLLTEKDWSKVQNVLHGRDYKWQAIGIQLSISHAELTRIRQECGDNLEECNREMQIAWLKTGRATWAALARALRSAPIGLLEDAKRIQEKYSLDTDCGETTAHLSSRSGTFLPS